MNPKWKGGQGLVLQLNHPQNLDADVENGIVSGFHPRDSGSALIDSKIVTLKYIWNN